MRLTENERMFLLTQLFSLAHVNSNLIFILRILGKNNRSFRLKVICNTILFKVCLSQLVSSSRYWWFYTYFRLFSLRRNYLQFFIA